MSIFKSVHVCGFYKINFLKKIHVSYVSHESWLCTIKKIILGFMFAFAEIVLVVQAAVVGVEALVLALAVAALNDLIVVCLKNWQMQHNCLFFFRSLTLYSPYLLFTRELNEFAKSLILQTNFKFSFQSYF